MCIIRDIVTWRCHRVAGCRDRAKWISSLDDAFGVREEDRETLECRDRHSALMNSYGKVRVSFKDELAFESNSHENRRGRPRKRTPTPGQDSVAPHGEGGGGPGSAPPAEDWSAHGDLWQYAVGCNEIPLDSHRSHQFPVARSSAVSPFEFNGGGSGSAHSWGQGAAPMYVTGGPAPETVPDVQRRKQQITRILSTALGISSAQVLDMPAGSDRDELVMHLRQEFEQGFHAMVQALALADLQVEMPSHGMPFGDAISGEGGRPTAGTSSSSWTR